MKYTFKKVGKISYQFLIFILLSTGTLMFWWKIAGKIYFLSTIPMGGDYFNALTYVNFFDHNFPFPPMGWIPFWNEGSAVIGGYPWLAFYIMKPLMIFLEPASAMEVFAGASLGLFFIVSLLLFRQVSKSWLVAFSLTLVLTATRATYYQLMTGGFIVSASAQWYLPLVLLFIYKFGETAKKQYLIVAAIFTGLSLLHHAPTSLLMTFLPASAVLLTLSAKPINRKSKLADFGLFVLLSCAIGLAGLYTVFLQTFSGSGTDLCQSPQCWGIYPKHLIVWMSILTPVFIMVCFILAVFAKLLRKSTKILSFLPAFTGFLVFFLYALLAYLRLINGVTNVIFPTRIFWAANVFLLLVSAHLFSSFKKALPKVSLLITPVILIATGYAILTNIPIINREYMNTDPVDIFKYTVPKYKTQNITKLVPNWVPLNEVNWRLDTFNAGLIHWWNTVAQIPSTRGYSAHPTGVHRDWQYYLQVSTRDPKSGNDDLIRNRALFLLDAYGIGYHESSIIPYPQSILSDSQIVLQSGHAKIRRDVTWYQFSPSIVSPIVSPTNSHTLLVIGDDDGYENFIRTISMTNLNSFSFIPVKGPKNIDSISVEELKAFKAVILYRYSGNDWSKISQYVKQGGFVFIETGSLDKHPRGKLPDIFPAESFSQLEILGKFSAVTSKTPDVTENVAIDKFSPFIYEGGPWKLSTTNSSYLQPWAEPLLLYKDNILLAHGMYGKGRVVWSGINLIYHIVQYDNYEEAKLFANLLSPLISKNPEKPTFSIEKKGPRIINITGKNFSGIYFKENYHPGWIAKINGNYVKIVKAGLDFMYIPVSINKSAPVHVTLSFNGSPGTWLLFIISTSSLLLSCLYLIFPLPFYALKHHTHHHMKHQAGKRIFRWISEDEKEY